MVVVVNGNFAVVVVVAVVVGVAKVRADLVALNTAMAACTASHRWVEVLNWQCWCC